MPTIKLRGKRVETLLPTNWVQGAQVVWTDDLFVKGHAAVVGEQSGFLTIVRVLPSTQVRFQNICTFTLTKGQITAQGIWDSYPGAHRIKLAVTGGTEKYENTHGVVDVVLKPGSNPPITYTARFNINYTVVGR
jgi:hypothetical protein